MNKIAICICLLIISTAGLSQEVFDFKSYSPEFDIVRIDESEAPVIDGDLSDDVWTRAAKLDEFYQVEPVEGAAPSEKTIAYVMYDKNNLYVGIYAYENEIDSIQANIMQRDNNLWRDTNVRLFIDPYDTGRDGMSFIINPLGAQHDRLIENNSRHADEWDTIWDVEARIVEDGWIVELALPFRSISFAENIEDWRFDITRDIRQKNERVRWSQINQSLDFRNISQLGTMRGIRDTERGKGLDIQGFVKAGASRDRRVTPHDDDQFLRPSGNIFYKVTPSLTGTLTFNTDFSDTPLDARQVNTGRFGLFFPETRDFMLQDQSIFEFGGRVIRPTEQFAPNGTPFFSRRLGIVGNQVADIKLGGKLSGRIGDYNVGLLTAKMTEEPGLDSEILSVARVSKDVLDDSRIGAIFTHGDPTGLDTNSVFGFDFQYSNTNYKGTGNQLVADAYYERSLSDNPLAVSQGMDDDAFGVYASYPNDHLFWDVRIFQVGENFHPALGFVNRRGIRNYNAIYKRRYRQQGSWLRWWEWSVANTLVTDLDDTVETHNIFLNLDASSQLGDEVSVSYTRSRENILQPFLIAGRLPVPISDYRFDVFKAEYNSSFARPIRLTAVVQCCEIYNGDRLRLSASMNWRMSKYFNAEFEYSRDHFDLPTGELTVHVAEFTSSINFSPDMQIDTQLQYDNISEAFSYFSRFRWFPRPETEYFASIGHTAILESDHFPGRFISDQTQLVFRLGHTFRF